jgi:hypothetical protein
MELLVSIILFTTTVRLSILLRMRRAARPRCALYGLARDPVQVSSSACVELSDLGVPSTA